MGIVLTALNAPFALRRLKAARALLSDLTPLKSDCGRLCEGACCQPDETGLNGMLLYPHEEKLYRKTIEGFAFTLLDDDGLYKGGKRLVCEGVCPREHRPLACRIFPLRMRVNATDDSPSVTAELDPRAWAVCPLLEEGGLRAMRSDFIKAVETAGEILCANTEIFTALLNEQRALDEARHL